MIWLLQYLAIGFVGAISFILTKNAFVPIALGLVFYCWSGTFILKFEEKQKMERQRQFNLISEDKTIGDK